MNDTPSQQTPELANPQDTGSRTYVYLVSAVAAIGGLLFGFDTAVISGANVFIQQQFAVTPLFQSLAAWLSVEKPAALQEGFIVSNLLIGCVVGVSVAGTLSDRFGRRRVLIAAAVLYAMSAVLSALPRTVEELIAARFIGGLGVGIASMLSPMYIAEVAPARIRGRLVTMNQLAIITGILAAYVVDWLLVDIGPTNWRWMFASEALPAGLFLIALLFVPESPRWLIKEGRTDDASDILTRVGGRTNAQKELLEIRSAIAEEAGSVRQLFEPGLRIALVIGVVMAILQQVTGINTILYYAPRIFLNAGYENASSAFLASIIVGATNALCTVIALWLIDKVGRKPLLLVGSAGMGVSFLVLGLAFRGDAPSGPWILIPILSYVACFAVGLGPVVWVLLSEIFPTRIRGRAMSLATICLWIACFGVSQTFPVLVENKHIGPSGTFWMYAIMCAVTFVFVWRVVFETKGKTLEQIERLLIETKRQPKPPS